MTPINPNHVVAASPSDTSQGVSEAYLGALEHGEQFAKNRGYAVGTEWIRGFNDAIGYVRAALRSEPTGEQS